MQFLFIGITVILIVLGVAACGAKTYSVDYCGEMELYEGAKDSYRAGAQVTLYYGLIATDTDYTFYLDGEPIEHSYDNKKGFVISFVMPEHDVKLECVTKNTMADYVPLVTE